MTNILIAHQPQFDFQDTPLYWYDHSILKTIFINAFSCLIPQTEAFLVLAIQEIKEQIKDLSLRNEIEIFLEQEKNHMVAHSAFNRYLESLGFPIRSYIQAIQKYLSIYKVCSLEQKLQLCILMESITSSLCENYIRSYLSEYNQFAPHQLLMWHSIEELDHRCLAYRVHQELYQTYQPKYFRNAFFSVKTTWMVFKIILNMLHIQKNLYWPKTWKDIFWLLGPKGPVYLSLKGYLNFIKQSYNPGLAYLQDEQLIQMSKAWKANYRKKTNPNVIASASRNDTPQNERVNSSI